MPCKLGVFGSFKHADLVEFPSYEQLFLLNITNPCTDIRVSGLWINTGLS